MVIYHNPRCSKSRQALQLCEEAAVDLDVVEYLRMRLDEVGLTNLLKKLGKKAHQGRGILSTGAFSGFQ